MILSNHSNVLIDLLEICNCVPALRLFTTIILLLKIEINGKCDFERKWIEEIDKIDTFYIFTMRQLLNWMAMERQKNRGRR